jgi:hypothetical protein
MGTRIAVGADILISENMGDGAHQRAQGTPPSHRVAVGAVSLHLPLTDSERAICKRMHVDEATYVESKARRKSGRDPLSDSPLGGKISNAPVGPRGAGAFEQR